MLVTAAHVLEEMAGDSAIVHLRKQVDKENNSWIDVPTPIAIRANNQPLWMRHPEADVAVMYINVPDDEAITLQLLPTTMLADDKMLMDYDIKPGDDFDLSQPTVSHHLKVLRQAWRSAPSDRGYGPTTTSSPAP